MRERQPGIYESTYSGEEDMDRKCSKCGGDLIEGALLDGLSFQHEKLGFESDKYIYRNRKNKEIMLYIKLL